MIILPTRIATQNIATGLNHSVVIINEGMQAVTNLCYYQYPH